MLTTIRALTIAGASLILLSCEEMIGFSGSNRFHEDFHYAYDLKPGGRLSLENKNGSIEIIGWEKDSVDISGTKYAATKELLSGLKIDVVSSPDSVRIRTVAPSGRHGNYGAKYVIRVPNRVELERIASSNGSIRAESIEGSARIETSNGAIRVSRLRGPLEAVSSNGSVEVTDQDGSVIARTSNGRIRIDEVKGSLEAVTSNGSISARLSEPEPQRPIRLQSSNGSIELTMEALNNNDVRISTSNSSITLRLPEAAQAQLNARTNHSQITTDFDVAVSAGEVSKSRLEGKIGAGGPLVDLSTSNASIRVLKL